MRRSAQQRARIDVVQLGQQDYLECWNLQRRLALARRRGLVRDLLLLVEHPPTYTIGRRGRRSNLLIDDATLASLGATCHLVDRGGDITFHGPGQLVCYVIVDLGQAERSVRRFVERLEAVVISVLGQFGVAGSIDSSRPGVWVDRDKIAALGISISRGVTYHGFALNVDPDLRFFDYMIPCGIPDRGVTSLAREIGGPVAMSELADRIVAAFGDTFGLRPGISRSLDELQQILHSIPDAPAMLAGVRSVDGSHR